MGVVMSLIPQKSAGKVPGEKRKSPGSEEGDAPENKKQKLETKKNLCPVCLDNMDGAELMATPCAHLYHTLCIMTSYQFTDRCPVCRTPIEELAGAPYSGPTPVENDDPDDEDETEPPTQASSGQRTSHRSQQASTSTPYSSENETNEQPAQGMSPEVGSTLFGRFLQVALQGSLQPASGDVVQEDATYQGEYSPVASSSEEDSVPEVEDADDSDYVPPTIVCVICQDEVESFSASDGDDETPLCQDCRADLDDEGGSGTEN